MAIQNLLSLSYLLPAVAQKLDFSRAIRGLTGMPRRLLLVGHKLAAGAATVNTRMTITTETDAIAAFGEGSMLVAMWRAAKANIALGLPIDVIAVAPGNGAAAASSTLVLTGTPTAAGELPLYVGGVRVSVGVTTVDTLATMATKLTAAINAVPKLPLTAATNATPGQVVLTAKWAGPTGNDIDLRATHYVDDALPAGVTVAVPAMSGGTVQPDLSPVVVAMQQYRATEIVCPFTDSTSLALLEAELAARWAANNMQDGAVINCVRGTEAALTTFLAARNSPHVHTIVVSKDCTSPWETAAMAGAAIESQASVDPALPHTGIVLAGYMGPRQGDGLLDEQQNNLMLVGGSALLIAPDGTGTLRRMVTNYKRAASGAPDRSMAELCWLKTMSYYRWFVVTEWQTKYWGFKLAQYITEPVPGQKVMTVDLAEEIMIGIYKLFCDAVLCQNPDYYRQALVVEIDAPNGKLKIVDEPVIVTQHYQTEITSSVVAGQV